ncbi:MGDG synthase family glycosyltransferase [Paenibacillus aestuarii]|uniref:Glycosyltransferase n=1 Tax=Paenibacillus aestuarii TaxID=516965 RepID=A0ABW0K5R4_9BACL|nr:glycosyltransferase [Paenibacillus aestuarii]
MDKCSRILILTASFGEGHLLAAFALMEHFKQMGVEHVEVIDLMKEAHPFINMISSALYKGSFKAANYGFNYYGWSYYLTQRVTSKNGILAGLNRLGASYLQKLIAEKRPDVILNTFPYGAAPIVGSHQGIPTYTIITDYLMHARWLHPCTDKYYVATNDLKQDIMKVGVQGDHIAVTGIPIRKAFESKKQITTTHASHKMILLFAGSHSVFQETEDMIRKLQGIKGCKVHVVCGRNAKLQHYLEGQFRNDTKVTIYGFVEKINELMAQASGIITKAGGLTMAETMALQIPVFIFRPFPGQEKDNANYLANKGVAVIANDINELTNQIEYLMNNGSYAKQIKEQMAILHQSKAADAIVRDVLSRAYRQSSVVPLESGLA